MSQRTREKAVQTQPPEQHRISLENRQMRDPSPSREQETDQAQYEAVSAELRKLA